MSETPRTDAVAQQCIGQGSPMSYVRAIDLARQLERELAFYKRCAERSVEILVDAVLRMDGALRSIKPTAEPFCWYKVTRDIADEYVTVYSEDEPNEQGWKPLYELPPTMEKPCPLCGRTDPHSHSSGPLGMS